MSSSLLDEPSEISSGLLLLRLLLLPPAERALLERRTVASPKVRRVPLGPEKMSWAT